MIERGEDESPSDPYQHPWSNKTAAKVKLISDAFSPSVRNQRTGDGQRLQPIFSLGNKKPRLVSIHAESTGVTGVFEVRLDLEGSGRDADPCQRQLLGPSVLANRRGAAPKAPTPPAQPESAAHQESW